MIEITEGYAGLLLLADVHFDNPHCRRDILEGALRRAANENLGVCVVGDWFCAMQGKADKRGGKSSIRAEDNNDDYLGSLVRNSVAYLSPYKERVAILAPGNHETSVLKRSEFDLTKALADGLGIQPRGYAGFARFAGSIIYYHHGHGGGGESTRGTMQAARRSVYVPDADILVSGHIHEAWVLASRQVRIGPDGEYYHNQWHVSVPTMKDEYSLSGGYHLENGRPPKPLGYAVIAGGRVSLEIF